MMFSSICKTGDREVNQDCVLTLERGQDCCFVVADGLGAHGRGEEAARMAVDAFENCFYEAALGNNAFLTDAFNRSQEEIQSQRHKPSEMKTTCVALSIIGNRFSFGHIGDSRLYYFSKKRFRERTIDHSVPQILALSGDITEDEMRHHADRGKLLRALGDPWDEPGFELSKERKLKREDAFLLCSDGFWGNISKDEIIQTLKQSGTAEKWLEAMLFIVEEYGKETDMDNYSAITVML